MGILDKLENWLNMPIGNVTTLYHDIDRDQALLEDGSMIPIHKTFDDGKYAHTGNGKGNTAEYRNILSKREAEALAADFRRRGWKARVIKHGSKYLLYTKS